MSLPGEKIGDSDAVVEESISSPDGNDDTSTSAEIYEAARKLEDMEESKKLLGSASDADVSSFSSSDSTQTVVDADIAGKSGTGLKLQRSPKQNFKRMKFDEECQVKLEDDESSDEKESKLCVKKEKKSPRKPKCDTKEVTDSAAACSSGQGQILKTGSKRTRLDSDKQMNYIYSSSESETKSVQQSSSSNIEEKLGEVTTKKIIVKKSPEMLKKTRLGSSEIAADVIEDAIDHTDESVFTNVGSTDFITTALSNTIYNTGIVTDITDDAVDHTDQAVFAQVSSSDSIVAAVLSTGHNTGIVTGVTEDSIDNTVKDGSAQVKSSDLIAAVVSNILHKEVSPQPHICKEDKEQTAQEERESQKHDLQEAETGEVSPATVSTIFSQVSQIEGGIILEKSESSSESNHSDERMEFSSESTIPSGMGYNTDIERMDCSSDTYSGFESFKIGNESDTTLEKMECKSESSASRDKMETESFKSNETEGMEFSSESISNFEQKPISVQENEPINVQENEPISVQENEAISVQENEFINLHENEYIGVYENESISVQENESISVHENESISVQENESISLQENESISVQENESISVQENETISVQENETISVQENESNNVQENIKIQENESFSVQVKESNIVQENKPITILQREEGGNQILESISSRIGDLVNITIHESDSYQPCESNDFDNNCNDSDSNSNEIKAIYKSNTDTNIGTERKFTIPHQEASDTDEYEQKQVSEKAVYKKISNPFGESSLKRRNSSEDKKVEETTAGVKKTTEVQKQSTSSLAELPDTDSDEFKDVDDVDRKGHKKLKK